VPLTHLRCRRRRHSHPPLQPLGFALEGNPLPAYNGAYRKVSEHKGWPVLRNGAGKFCYRYEPTNKWFLRNEHLPDSDLSNSWIASAEGPLPIGAQTWRCHVDGKWVDGSLSVTVLVRPFPSLMLSAASACISSDSLSHSTVLSRQQCQAIQHPHNPSPTSALAMRLCCCRAMRMLYYNDTLLGLSSSPLLAPFRHHWLECPLLSAADVDAAPHLLAA
jgi:hypothetical protein